MKTASWRIAFLCTAAFVAGGALAQDRQDRAETTVSPLNVGPPMAPIPEVGVGAPQLSLPEIKEIEQIGEKCVGLRDGHMTDWFAKYFEPRLAAVAKGIEVFDGVVNINEYKRDIEQSPVAEVALAALLRDTARAAEEATLASERIRRQPDATAEAMAKAELDRQAAINKMIVTQAFLTEIQARRAEAAAATRARLINNGPLTIQGTPIHNYTRKAGATLISAEAFADLGIQKVVVQQRQDENGGAFLQVSGEIHNTRKRTIDVPPIRVTAFDDRGFPLKSVTAVPEKRGQKIAAGGSEAFAYRLAPAPANAVKVIVGFGSNATLVPFRPTAPLGCERPDS